MVDEGLPSITCGVGGCQRTVPSCVGGVPQSCTPGAPSAEVCSNAVDEDCDGILNNGCPPPPCMVMGRVGARDGNYASGALPPNWVFETSGGESGSCSVVPGAGPDGSPAARCVGDGLSQGPFSLILKQLRGQAEGPLPEGPTYELCYDVRCDGAPCTITEEVMRDECVFDAAVCGPGVCCWTPEGGVMNNTFALAPGTWVRHCSPRFGGRNAGFRQLRDPSFGLGGVPQSVTIDNVDVVEVVCP